MKYSREMPESTRLLPEDPLGFIRGCVDERQVFWTYHVNIRLAARFIPREVILGATASYESIESYPEDKYLPSYLLRAEHEGAVFHVLYATDVGHRNVRIVTAYWPDPEEWEDNLRRRRLRP